MSRLFFFLRPDPLKNRFDMLMSDRMKPLVRLTPVFGRRIV